VDGGGECSVQLSGRSLTHRQEAWTMPHGPSTHLVQLNDARLPAAAAAAAPPPELGVHRRRIGADKSLLTGATALARELRG